MAEACQCLGAQPAVLARGDHQGAAGTGAIARPGSHRRDLAGQQLVIAEALAGPGAGTGWALVIRERPVTREMQQPQCQREPGPASPAHEFRVQPFGEVRQPCQGCAHRACHRSWPQSRGQPPDRLDRWHQSRFSGRTQVIGTHHPQAAGIPLQSSGDHDPCAGCKPACLMWAEEHQLRLAAAVIDADDPRLASARGQTRGAHRHQECRDPARRLAVRVPQHRPPASVDDRDLRQVEQQVEQYRAAGRARQQGGRARPQPGKARDRRQQRCMDGQGRCGRVHHAG